MSEVCLACFGANLSVVNGVLVCEDCGTQCLAQVEETEHEEVGGAGITRRRAAGSSRAAPRSLVVDKELEPDEARARVKTQGRAYLQCLQLVMQAQADVLINTFHVISEARPLIRHIWLALLPHLRCLDFEFYKSDFGAVDSGLAGLDQNGINAEHQLPQRTDFAISGRQNPQLALKNKANRDQKRKGLEQERLDKNLVASVIQIAPVVKAFTSDISLQTTIAICILACIILKQPVTPSDIVRWALDGQLPFLDAGDRCRHMLRALDPLVAAPLHTLLHPSGVTPATSLLVSAIELSSMLGLQLPNVNGPVLLYKACCELALPEEVFLVANELHNLFLQDSPLLSPLSMSYGHHPYCLLMSVTAIATWLCFGLDSSEHNATHFPQVPAPPLSPALQLPRPAGQPSGGLDADANQWVALNQDHTKPEEDLGPRHSNLERVLPPSRAAMMQRASQQQQQNSHDAQQHLSHTFGVQLPDIRAQQEIEDEVAARTSAIQASGWLPWAQARMQEHTRPHSYPASVAEACRLRGAELAAYLQYCKQVVLAGARLPQGFNDLGSSLEQMSQSGQPVDGGVSTHTQSIETGQHAQRVEAGSAQYAEHNVEAVGEQEDVTEGQLPQQAQLHGVSSSAPAASRVHSHPHKFTSISIQMMSADVHNPDLLAVAAACGALVNVHPDLILRQMSILQHRLTDLEKHCATLEN